MKKIIEAILKCKDNKIAEKSYRQYKLSKVEKRIYTGVGFFTSFYIDNINEDMLLPNDCMQLGGIHAEIKGLKNGAGFVLFIKEGRLNTLEEYTYNESRPETAHIRGLFAVKEDGALIPFKL